jgi:transposase
MDVMENSLAARLVPDDLWELAEPLLPRFETRRQGGGTAAIEDRAVFTAVVYVLTAGCAWRHLPEEFGVSVPTAHRRFHAWTRVGVWPRLHRAVLDAHGVAGDVDWSSVIVDAASLRAKKGDL